MDSFNITKGNDQKYFSILVNFRQTTPMLVKVTNLVFKLLTIQKVVKMQLGTLQFCPPRCHKITIAAKTAKTLETRNGTMFTPYPEGTKMLLHVGQRTYPDGNRHLDVMRSGGLSDDEITTLKSLPQGYGKGMAVAIVEIGKTYETTLEERCEPDFQRMVGAFGEDSGMRATEIKRVAYLKRGVKVSGKGGVFKSDIDRDAIPDGWL